MRQVLLMCALLGAAACTSEPTIADETTEVGCITNADCTATSECVQYATGESVCVREALDQVGPAGQPPPPAHVLQPVAANPRAAMPRSPR